MNLKELWNERRQLVEDHLTEELNLDGALDKTLCESMQYSLMAGGKRLRPILLMAAADAVGAKGTDYLESACAIEMIHTYSLIHDDLPAMDDDDYRRGKLTNHKVYGAGMATLAGDALLTLAFEVMLRQPDTTPENILRVVREMSTAAGPDGMVGGQALDLESEDKQISMETLRRMHMGKTGALFRAAIRSGAILGGASAIELSSLTEYADNFGLAFQITDDVLDVTGDEAVIGKPVGSDEKNHKATYVSLYSLAEAKKMAAAAVAAAVNSLARFGERAAVLRSLAEYLPTRES